MNEMYKQLKEMLVMIILTAVLLLVMVLMTGCSLGQKSWGMANSCDAFKVVIADPQSSSIAPEIIAGGGVNTMCFQKPFPLEEKVPSMFAYSRRKSMWGMFSGSTWAGNVSAVYISGSAETPEDTIKILEKLSKIVNPSQADNPKTE